MNIFMRKKKWVGFCLFGIMLFYLLTGCGEKDLSEKAAGTGKSAAREKVTIAFWSDQLTEYYGEYLRDKFPEVDFEFYAATNSTDFYRMKEENGDLPDILTVRRFALKDVASWRESLMDLSDSELANTFYQTYLRNYTYDDGTVNWLPACAEVDSIIINKTLLEENGLAVPTDYPEFVETCMALKDLGIRPFRSDFGADYTCMEILQGLSISRLNTKEGREWRQKYESGQTDQLSEEVWLPVFERMAEFIEYAGITESDLEDSFDAVFDAYKNRQTAMIRGTGEEAVLYNVDRESVLMPYYGETEEDNWYLTYPAFQVAASRDAEESPERKQLILDIMTAMLNEEGLRNITGGQNMIAYNKDVALEPSPLLEYLPSCVNENRLYIRLASSDMFSASQKVVGGMLTGEYPDAKSAYEAFNEAMGAGQEKEAVAAHIDTGYTYAFSPDGGSPAASAIMNSLREEVGTQLLIGQSVIVAGNIAAGDYTETELGFLTMGETASINLCSMTGEQVYGYIDYVLAAEGKRGSVINDTTLYVSSGFEMEIQKKDAGYELVKLTIDGKEMDRSELYSIAVVGSEALMLKDALDSVGIHDYTKEETSFKQLIADRLSSDGGELAQPSDYITLREKTD